jgi:hypothetical protein
MNWVSSKLRYPVPPPCVRHFAPDFLERCLSTPESSVDTTLHSPSSTPLLREWAKSKLTGGSWRNALVAALNVSISFCSGAPRWLDTVRLEFTAPRFTIYCALCDHLEMTNYITDAIECFHQMNSELVGETNTRGERAKWAAGECLSSRGCSVYVIDLLQTLSSVALRS